VLGLLTIFLCDCYPCIKLAWWLKFTVSWDVTTILVDHYRCFGRLYCLHFQGSLPWRWQMRNNINDLLDYTVFYPRRLTILRIQSCKQFVCVRERARRMEFCTFICYMTHVSALAVIGFSVHISFYMVFIWLIHPISVDCVCSVTNEKHLNIHIAGCTRKVKGELCWMY
jgi:hypothetical protein